jgi:hypothetical protein
MTQARIKKIILTLTLVHMPMMMRTHLKLKIKLKTGLNPGSRFKLHL